MFSPAGRLIGCGLTADAPESVNVAGVTIGNGSELTERPSG